MVVVHLKFMHIFEQCGSKVLIFFMMDIEWKQNTFSSVQKSVSDFNKGNVLASVIRQLS